MNRSVTIWVFAFLIPVTISCDEKEETDPELSAFQFETIQYFNEIALGFEFGDFSEVTRKWKKPMKVFAGGTPSDENVSELQLVSDEINKLVTDGFHIELVSDSANCNFYVHFGSRDDYVSFFPEISTLIDNSDGMSYPYFNRRAELIGGHMLVDNTRTSPNEQRHLIREELTQSIGLARHSVRYKNSVFLRSGNSVTAYADIDRELVRLLYHPYMVVGVSAPGSTAILQNIYFAENSD
jgi:hypothetical protein